MITLRSKKTGKLLIASDNPSIVKGYIIGRYNKAFELFKQNSNFPLTNIDYFNVSLDDFQKSIDSFKQNVIIWQHVYKAFILVCPAFHVQKSVNTAETGEYEIERAD